MIKKELALPVPFLFYSFALRHWRKKIPHSAECGDSALCEARTAHRPFQGLRLAKRGDSHVELLPEKRTLKKRGEM